MATYFNQYEFTWDGHRWVFPLVRESVTELATLFDSIHCDLLTQYQEPEHRLLEWNMRHLYVNAEECRTYRGVNPEQNVHFYRWWLDAIVREELHMVWNYVYIHERRLLVQQGVKRDLERKADTLANEMKTKYEELFK